MAGNVSCEAPIFGLIEEKVCANHGIDGFALRSGRRTRKLSDARTDFCCVAHNYFGLSFAQIAKYLCRDPSTVRRHVG